MDAREPHQELGHFLTTRRHRQNPREHGFPVGPRRRARGLRREEVALLADVSATWYTYLEQGRRVQPSAEVVGRLCEALRLTGSESRYLRLLADPPATAPALWEELDATSATLVEQVVALNERQHEPVFATDPLGRLIAWNTATVRWYGDFSRWQGSDRNFARWLLVEPEARERVVSWSTTAREMVGRLRFVSATHHRSITVRRALEALRGACPEFDRFWATHDVYHEEVWQLALEARGGPQRFRLARAQLTACPSVEIVLHLPCP